MMSRRKLHLVLELRNATIGDSGNYTCRVVHQGKTYYREVTVTVKRSGIENKDNYILTIGDAFY